MGKRIKNYQRHNTKWIDRSCDKHMHIYDVPVAVELTDSSNHITYYTAFKCRYCNSFKDAVFSDDTDLPLLKLRFRKPNYKIGFKDIEFIGFD